MQYVMAKEVSDKITDSEEEGMSVLLGFMPILGPLCLIGRALGLRPSSEDSRRRKQQFSEATDGNAERVAEAYENNRQPGETTATFYQSAQIGPWKQERKTTYHYGGDNE